MSNSLYQEEDVKIVIVDRSSFLMDLAKLLQYFFLLLLTKHTVH
jgi:hypothetical protein